MTKEEAQQIAEEEFTFADFIQERDGALAGMHDHHELEDMASWREYLEPRVEEILAGDL